MSEIVSGGVAGPQASESTIDSSNIMNNKDVALETRATANASTIMSPRLLAQDAVKRYMEGLDSYVSHSSNIQSSFRPIVFALTYFVMSQTKRQSWCEYLEDVMHQTMQNANSHDEKKTVTLESPHQETTSPSVLPTLDRRTLARLEAFVSRLRWSVPCSIGSLPDRRKLTNNDETAPDHAASVSLLDGLSGFHSTLDNQHGHKPSASSKLSGSSLLRSISSGSAGVSPRDAPKLHPQIRSLDLTIQLELYLRTLFRVVKNPNHEPCVLEAEPLRAIKARAVAIVTAFSETVGTVRQQGPVLTRLITFMTMELLAVSCLSESCKGAIRNLVVEYEHQTSFASLAFLSSPEDAANQKLVPLLNLYFNTLKENWETAVRDCELEDMLATVLDPHMREFFKTVEFTSIGHLLTCAHGFRSLLQKIELPPTYTSRQTPQDEGTVRQAIRDLQRERITVNGHLLPTVKSRTELVRLISQTLNSASLTSTGPAKTRRRRSRRKRVSRHTESDPAALRGNENNKGQQQLNEDLDDESEDLSTGSESDGGSSAESTVSSGRRSFDISTVDLLTKRLLLAASRTGTGGDAYFIVRDLFGGKDVQVLAHQQPRGLGGTNATTIELWAHLGSLTIKCHTSFDVYPLLQDHGKRDPYAIMDFCEPLIQLHTTTTEVITLQEVRASDAMPNGKSNHQDGAFVLQERITPKTGWRTLSIRPAVYEKLEVWTTPS